MRQHRLQPNPQNPKLKRPKLIKNPMESELGTLNKDNLDDLLLDMSFYMTSSEMDCDDRVKQMFSSMTELSQALNQEHRAKQMVLRSSYKGPGEKTLTLDLIPALSPEFSKLNRRRGRIMSKVGEFYIGKPRKKPSRLVIK
jgi:hypothetical protein